VVPAYVDVERPHVAEVVAGLADRGRRCVVVPLLLSAGYHVRVDIAAAVTRAGGGAVAARALGPDPALDDVLVERLAEAGTRPGDAVLLAAAGSSDERAVQDVRRVAARLGERLRHPVATCYLSSAEPALDEAVAQARRGARGGSGRVVVVTYLLGPGRLADAIAERAGRAGAVAVTRPLAGHPALARLALARYDEATADAVDDDDDDELG
jgi:sirohydrochlorin ferrochelatase